MDPPSYGRHAGAFSVALACVLVGCGGGRIHLGLSDSAGVSEVSEGGEDNSSGGDTTSSDSAGDSPSSDSTITAPIRDSSTSGDSKSSKSCTGSSADSSSNRSDGAVLTWTRVPKSPAGFAISGSGPTDVWLLASDYVSPGMGKTLRGDGVTWTPVDPSSGASPGFALWVAACDAVFVSGYYSPNNGVYRWDGSGWTGYNTGDRVVEAFWGSGPNDVWGARGDGQYLGHWDGSTWTSGGLGGVLAGGAPQDFWLAIPKDEYVTGPPSAIQPTSGGEGGPLIAVYPLAKLQHHAPSGNYDISVNLSTIGCGNCSVRAGWASAVDDVWFVGNVALHFDGQNWKIVSTPVTMATTTLLRGVWGSSKDDVWAVGDGGVIVHFDGAQWTSVDSPTTNSLEAVWSSGPNDVWAIGDAVYHATR